MKREILTVSLGILAGFTTPAAGIAATEDVRENIGQSSENYQERREEFLEHSEERLNESAEEIAEIEEKQNKATASDQSKKELKEAKEQIKTTREKLGELRSASAKNWQDEKKDFLDHLNRLDVVVNQAKIPR